MRIAFIIDSLYNSRGMERVLSTCSNMLCDVHNFSIITAFNEGKSDFFYLDGSIMRKDLGINHRRCVFSLFNNILVKRDYKKALQEYLIKNPQDIKEFKRLGYVFKEKLSNDINFVFEREK